MANGAKELLDEVATGKVTGEEERYSHTDLVDFKANVEGAETSYELLKPVASRNEDPSFAHRIVRCGFPREISDEYPEPDDVRAGSRQSRLFTAKRSRSPSRS